MLEVLVLSAGASSRMGCDKAWLALGPRWPEQSFLAIIVASARRAGAGPVAVVHGPTLAFRARIPRLGALPILNPDPAAGRTGSLQVGLRHLGRRALVLWPVDMPLVRAETVARLLEAARVWPACLVQPAFGGRLGHPLVLPPASLERISEASPETPLRALLRGLPRKVLHLGDPGVRSNINTPDDYDAARLDATAR